MTNDLDTWIARQRAVSVDALERAISATQLRRDRTRFGQSIVPARGSVLASPEIADWNPEPDYFFHWLRDSAIVMRTVVDLMEDAVTPHARARWQRHFDDFVRFSLALADVEAVQRSSRQPMATIGPGAEFLRPENELAALSTDVLLSEPRFNPDGSVDIFRWSRPQFDGPALRALACLRYLAAGAAPSPELTRLLRLDLDFTIRHAGEPCIGPWEEPGQMAHHYYVTLVQFAALVHGCAFSPADAAWRQAESRLSSQLERFWSEHDRFYRALDPPPDGDPDNALDSATLLAACDAELASGPHSPYDPRVQATQSALERLFARELPINRRMRDGAPALGRNRGDKYFGGGAWYPTTLAAAALHYRQSTRASNLDERRDLFARGDAFMTTVRALTPPVGAMAEQVDRETGLPTSARHLTWSYAAFLAAARARAQAERCDGASVSIA